MQSKVYGPILKIGKCLTSNGVLVDANIVNPTMSQKRMLTSSNSSAWTDVNNLSWSATGLNREIKCHDLGGGFSDKFAVRHTGRIVKTGQW